MCTLLNTVLTEVLNSGIRKIRALIGKDKVKLSLLADSTPGKLQGINDNANSNSERINKLAGYKRNLQKSMSFFIGLIKKVRVTELC